MLFVFGHLIDDLTCPDLGKCVIFCKGYSHKLVLFSGLAVSLTGCNTFLKLLHVAHKNWNVCTITNTMDLILSSSKMTDDCCKI